MTTFYGDLNILENEIRIKMGLVSLRRDVERAIVESFDLAVQQERAVR